MKHGSTIWAALLGLAAVGASSAIATPAEATDAGTAKVASPESAASPAKQRLARRQRVSVRDPASTVHHGRRRMGSAPTEAAEPETPLPGEVVGGVTPHPKHVAGGAHVATHPAPSAGQGASKRHRVARVLPSVPKGPCLHDAVQFERGFGGDLQPVVLTRCDGRPAPQAIEQMSVIVRPMNAPRPTVPTTPVRHGGGQREWMPGIKLIHEGLVTRLQKVIDHFQAKKITVVSGYRPASLGSFHQSARALDFHIDGVSNETLVAFCRTLTDTGCGYYPNSSFVHMDVRAPETGHVYWIDSSGPGEPARYVAAWPPRDSGAGVTEIPRPDPAAPRDEQTHLDSPGRLPLGSIDAKVDARTTAPLSVGDGKDDPFAP